VKELPLSMKTAAIVILIVLAVLLVALLGAGQYFYNYAIVRKKKAFMEETPDLDDRAGNGWREGMSWLELQPYRTLRLTAPDGIPLQGYALDAPSPTNKTVILVHGYDSKGKGMAAFARYYHEQFGYHVLMPDLRGHGESGGRYVGFGWHDRLDLLAWMQQVIGERGAACEIILHGISMGGAAVLMASGETLPAQVKGIISDCAYTSAGDILAYQLKRMFKLPAFPLIPATGWICRLRAGYDPRQASAVKQVRKATKPLLFIHGEADHFVPTAMVHTLYEAAPARDKQIVLIPGAGHAAAYFTDSATYLDQVAVFLAKCSAGPKQEIQS